MTRNEYTQENPRINQQDRQVTFHGSANPMEFSQPCTPATYTEAVHCQRVLLGVFQPRLWPLTAPGSTFWGRVAKPLVSSLKPVPPLTSNNLLYLLPTTTSQLLNCNTSEILISKLFPL